MDLLDLDYVFSSERSMARPIKNYIQSLTISIFITFHHNFTKERILSIYTI